MGAKFSQPTTKNKIGKYFRSEGADGTGSVPRGLGQKPQDEAKGLHLS